jgi:hypothetical protein
MQRSQSLVRASAAAFDFDVVSDVPVRPSRKPDAKPDAASPDTGASREKAETAKA